MKITTKHEIGDWVIFFEIDNFVKGVINEIRVFVDEKKNVTFLYRILCDSVHYHKREDQIFKNTGEIIKKFNL